MELREFLTKKYWEEKGYLVFKQENKGDKGFPDFIIIDKDYNKIYIEVKGFYDKLRYEQISKISELVDKGEKVYLAFVSIMGAILILKVNKDWKLSYIDRKLIEGIECNFNLRKDGKINVIYDKKTKRQKNLDSLHRKLKELRDIKKD